MSKQLSVHQILSMMDSFKITVATAKHLLSQKGYCDYDITAILEDEQYEE